MLCFDIESYRDLSDPNYTAWKLGNISAPSNYKDAVKIAEYIQNEKDKAAEHMALSPLTGKIILIGLLSDTPLVSTSDSPFAVIPNTEYLQCQLEGDEATMLKKFWEILWLYISNNGSHIVSFNGKAFDLPYIIHRSTILNVAPPVRILASRLLNKYNQDVHVDLFNWFGGGSLVEWSYKLGITTSLQRDGNMIGAWYEQGQMPLIKEKNSIDLFQTSYIYNKIKCWL